MLAVAGQVQAQTYSTKKARKSVWNKMLSMRMEYFDRNNAADMMSVITNDTSAAVKNLVNILIKLIPDVYYVVMALKRIGEYHWLLVVSCFLLFPLKYIYAWVMGRKMQTNSAVVYGKIDIAMWLAFFLFAQNLFSHVDVIFDIWIRMKGMQGEFHWIIDVMDGPEEEQNATAAFPETGDIHFKDITFTYPETDQPALECQHE